MFSYRLSHCCAKEFNSQQEFKDGRGLYCLTVWIYIPPWFEIRQQKCEAASHTVHSQETELEAYRIMWIRFTKFLSELLCWQNDMDLENQPNGEEHVKIWLRTWVLILTPMSDGSELPIIPVPGNLTPLAYIITKHICMNAYIHAHIYTYVHTFIYAYINIHACIHA